MGVKDKLLNLFHSGVTLSVAGTIVGTGGYVLYTDAVRYPRMMQTYRTGNILPPFRENPYEIKYCPREDEEAILREVLASKFTNEYYFINGEVGSGKTRTLVELCRRMNETSGKRREGSPIYISVGQGRSFPETLATAVHFLFDEHISFKFFLDFVVKIHSFPARDDHNKLTRVLDAIEKSAFMYMQASGKPVVLIVDGANYLTEQMPGALRKLQDKAKLWADTNTVKVVFVSNEDRTEMMLQEHHSNWARAATPIQVGDLRRDEAIAFLTSPGLYEYQMDNGEEEYPRMDTERAEQILAEVGGRVHYLIAFKRDWMDGIPVTCTSGRLREKEREKFLSVSQCPSMWKAVEVLLKSPGKTVLLSTLVRATTLEDVLKLVDAHVIKIERLASGVHIKFESLLTESVIGEMYGKLASMVPLHKRVSDGIQKFKSAQLSTPPRDLSEQSSSGPNKADHWVTRNEEKPAIKIKLGRR